MVVNPNQKNPIAPQNLYLHFSKVMIDCVGPLPETKEGKLTIICALTHFLEAVPLKNITAKTIVKALVKFFTVFGFPQAILLKEFNVLFLSRTI